MKKKSILYVVRLEPTISMLRAIRSIQRAKPDSDGYRIRKCITLKSLLFIMFANLKLFLRRYTSLYGIFMSASLTLFSYTNADNETFCNVLPTSQVVMVKSLQQNGQAFESSRVLLLLFDSLISSYNFGSFYFKLLMRNA